MWGGTGPRHETNFATCVVFLAVTRTKKKDALLGGVPTAAGLVDRGVDQGPWLQERVGGRRWPLGLGGRSQGFGSGVVVGARVPGLGLAVAKSEGEAVRPEALALGWGRAGVGSASVLGG